MADNPEFIVPEYKIDEDEEFVEDSRYELPPAIYGEETPEPIKEQFTDSWYKEGRGWKVVRGTGAAAVFLIVSVAGKKYFQKKYPEHVDLD